MIDRNLSLYDLDAERNVLMNLVQDKVKCKGVMMYNLITHEHFSDLFHRDSFNAILKYYKKYGTPPKQSHLKRYITKSITYHSKYKKKSVQRSLWVKSVDRLYKPLAKNIAEGFDADVGSLDELRKARVIQRSILESDRLFDDGDYEKVFDLWSGAIGNRVGMDVTIMEGDITEDIEQHENLIAMKQSGEIKPLPSAIRGVRENEQTGEYKIQYLDDFIGGGFYGGEMTLIIGDNNVGKSFTLMEMCHNVSRVSKMNVVLFTIEMNKVKQQMRIYSRITGIPYVKFRKGDLTKKEIQLWKEKMELWKRKYGMFYVVSFDKGATVLAIENKMKDIEQRKGVKIDFIAIDYLNDMTPLGKYGSSKSWDAMGEISWDLASLSKYWNNHTGIPIVTANQRKATKAGKDKTRWDEAAFSPLPAQHATIGIGITQGADDEAIGRIQWNIFKNREGDKNMSFYTYPDFTVSRISSAKKAKEYYGDVG
jgi:hypothetical protein